MMKCFFPLVILLLLMGCGANPTVYQQLISGDDCVYAYDGTWLYKVDDTLATRKLFKVKANALNYHNGYVYFTNEAELGRISIADGQTDIMYIAESRIHLCAVFEEMIILFSVDGDTQTYFQLDSQGRYINEICTFTGSFGIFKDANEAYIAVQVGYQGLYLYDVHTGSAKVVVEQLSVEMPFVFLADIAYWSSLSAPYVYKMEAGQPQRTLTLGSSGIVTDIVSIADTLFISVFNESTDSSDIFTITPSDEVIVVYQDAIFKISDIALIGDRCYFLENMGSQINSFLID